MFPAGSPTPDNGPPCPLATVDQIRRAADDRGHGAADFDPWYAFAAVDAELQADRRRPVHRRDVPHRRAGAPVLFAIDIAPAGGEPVSFDRVARRFGVGQAVWVEPPNIGGVVAGSCVPTPSASRCLALGIATASSSE